MRDAGGLLAHGVGFVGDKGVRAVENSKTAGILRGRQAQIECIEW